MKLPSASLPIINFVADSIKKILYFMSKSSSTFAANVHNRSMVNTHGQKVKNTAHNHASKAANHPALIMAARVGFVVSGILHIMIGWIAFQIATGSGGGEASNSGAMAQIASTPGGQILLWIMTVGLVGLGLWRIAEAFVTTETKDKAKSAAVGIVFLALSFSTLTFARGGSSSDGKKASSITASVLEMPGGKILISIAGLVIIGVGVYGIFKGATKRFKKDLETRSDSGNIGSAISVSGVVGYIARGIAFAVLGVMVIWAAMTSDPSKASGMDAAIRTIGSQPFGTVLLILTALGFILYGIYSMARAKYTNEV